MDSATAVLSYLLLQYENFTKGQNAIASKAGVWSGNTEQPWDYRRLNK
jgi:endonuclease YncB( thermonuclease family)